MNVWILTIGSSDVQLKTEKNWTNLNRSGRSQLKPDRGFSPSQSTDSDLFRVPARVMGVIYSQPQASLDDLAFPLIDNFINKLKAQQVAIDKVILVLSDQSVFSETKRIQRHPYWQDTCTLQPILEHYLTEQWKDVSPNLEIKPLLLEAASEEEGLDNWDAVLKLVQQKFASPGLAFPEGTTVYVSHQAGTPAISSAVQFSSLAKFSDRVRFLVSSEQDTKPPEILPSSSYLKGLRKQEAKKLLERYDYSGVKDLIDLDDEKDKETRILLEAAIQWNFAKFDEFANEIQNLLSPEFQDLVQESRERSQQWWWTAYEAAYLAWIRLDQGNTVEAFFHSFRSIEGAFSNWGKKLFCEHIEIEKDRAFLQPSLLESPHEYFREAKFKQDGTPKNSLGKLKKKLLDLAERIQNLGEKDKKPKGLLLSGDDLYILFRSQKPDYASDFDRFWNSEDGIGEKRNKNFHQLQGLSQAELLQDWEVDDLKNWEKRILTYLNFIVKEDLPEGFESLETASLMAQVHEKLKEAIESL